jgi:hypothetical protein
MFLDRPHLRFDGVYVSRNTYLRTGVVEWKIKNPVHLVCYFRYYRFFPDGERHPAGTLILCFVGICTPRHFDWPR